MYLIICTIPFTALEHMPIPIHCVGTHAPSPFTALEHMPIPIHCVGTHAPSPFTALEHMPHSHSLRWNTCPIPIHCVGTHAPFPFTALEHMPHPHSLRSWDFPVGEDNYILFATLTSIFLNRAITLVSAANKSYSSPTGKYGKQSEPGWGVFTIT